MELSVVIPVKNEAGNIGPLVAEIVAALDGGRIAYEIVYVDDGSSDATASEIAALQQTVPQLRLVRHRTSCGQSAAIRTGIKAAAGAWIATLDGDGQNDPADIPALWQMARDSAAAMTAAPTVTQPQPRLLIAGHRARRRDSWSKRQASRLANAVRRRLLHDDTPDTGCGLKLFPRDLFLDLPYFDHMHRFLPALVLREGGSVRSVRVNHRPRERGTSKYGVLDRLAVGIADLLGVIWLRRRSTRPHLIADQPAVDDIAAPPPATVGQGRSTQAGRLAVAALLAAGIAAAWWWRGLFDPQALTAEIARNPAAPIAYLLLHIAASLFFVPRTLLAIAAGLIFGMWWGVLWAAVGSVAGAVSGLLVARYLNAGWLDRAQPQRLTALLKYAERGDWRMVAMLRLVPVIPHSLTNYALGVTRVPLGAYALGSLLGQLPLTIAFVGLGAAGEGALLGTAADWRAQVLWPTLLGVAALTLSALFPLVARRRFAAAAGPAEPGG